MRDINLSIEDFSFYQISHVQATGFNRTESRHLLAVDFCRRKLIIGFKNELILIPFKFLVKEKKIDKFKDFKKPSTDIENKFVLKIAHHGSVIDYVSICGKRLAVSVHDVTKFGTYIHFYDLSRLNLNDTQAIPFCVFGVAGLDSTGFTRTLKWHPNNHDNILACVFSNGVFNLLRIDDPNQKNPHVSILAEYCETKVSDVSWSLKGTEIILSFEDFFIANFAHFKLTLPKNDLEMCVKFEESQSFCLPDRFRFMQIFKVHYISEFKFLAICRMDNNAIVLFVTLPSPITPDIPIKVLNAENPTYAFYNKKQMRNKTLEDLCFEPVGESFVFYSNFSENLGFIHPDEKDWYLVKSTKNDNCISTETIILSFNYLHGIGESFSIVEKKGRKFKKISKKNDYFFTYERSGILNIYLKVRFPDDDFLAVPKLQRESINESKAAQNIVVVQNSICERVVKLIINEFQELFDQHMKNLTKLTRKVQNFDLTKNLKALEEGIQQNVGIEKKIKMNEAMFDILCGEVLQSCLHNLFLSNITEERSNPGSTASALYMSGMNHFSNVNMLAEKLGKRILIVERYLKEARKVSESKCDENRPCDLNYQSINDLFRIAKRHELIINNFKRILSHHVEKQVNTSEESILKLKIVRSKYHEQIENLKNYITKRYEIPITRCGIDFQSFNEK